MRAVLSFLGIVLVDQFLLVDSIKMYPSFFARLQCTWLVEMKLERPRRFSYFVVFFQCSDIHVIMYLIFFAKEKMSTNSERHCDRHFCKENFGDNDGNTGENIN